MNDANLTLKSLMQEMQESIRIARMDSGLFSEAFSLAIQEHRRSWQGIQNQIEATSRRVEQLRNEIFRPLHELRLEIDKSKAIEEFHSSIMQALSEARGHQIVPGQFSIKRAGGSNQATASFNSLIAEVESASENINDLSFENSLRDIAGSFTDTYLGCIKSSRIISPNGQENPNDSTAMILVRIDACYEAIQSLKHAYVSNATAGKNTFLFHFFIILLSHIIIPQLHSLATISYEPTVRRFLESRFRNGPVEIEAEDALLIEKIRNLGMIRYISGDHVSLRALPRRNSNREAEMNKGDIIILLQKRRHWAHVQLLREGQIYQGWVFARYVAKL